MRRQKGYQIYSSPENPVVPHFREQNSVWTGMLRNFDLSEHGKHIGPESMFESSCPPTSGARRVKGRILNRCETVALPQTQGLCTGLYQLNTNPHVSLPPVIFVWTIRVNKGWTSSPYYILEKNDMWKYMVWHIYHEVTILQELN